MVRCLSIGGLERNWMVGVRRAAREFAAGLINKTACHGKRASPPAATGIMPLRVRLGRLCVRAQTVPSQVISSRQEELQCGGAASHSRQEENDMAMSLQTGARRLSSYGSRPNDLRK